MRTQPFLDSLIVLAVRLHDVREENRALSSEALAQQAEELQRAHSDEQTHGRQYRPQCHTAQVCAAVPHRLSF
jgi:hypothetical protein